MNPSNQSILAVSKLLNSGVVASLSAIGVCSVLAVSVQAQEALTNNAVQFSEDTIIEFEVTETHGFLQSTFGVINTRTGKKTPLFIETKPFDAWTGQPPAARQPGGQRVYDDYTGTVAGGSIVNGEGQASPLIKFRFDANTPYVFYLDSVNPYTKKIRTQLVSTNLNNTRFSGNLEAGESGNPINWEDTGLITPVVAGNDRDYNDFNIIAGGFVLMPCPIRR
jgi:hypothetical protein